MRHLVVALLLAAGCGAGGADTGGDQEPIDPGDNPDAGDGAGPPPMTKACDGVEVQLGTGARSFETVTDGDTVWLYRGPQGGYMIYLSIRAKGLDPSLVYVYYEIRRADTDQLIGTSDHEGQPRPWKVQLPTDLGGGWHERVGIWGEIEPEFWTRPSVARGHTVNVDVTLVDKQGCTVEGLGWTVDVNPDRPI
jgi:hypothetical protein